MANETMNLNTPILTLDSDTVLETAQSKADLIWHDIQNAYRTRKILTGILGGIEKTEAGSLIAIIYYKDYRAIIPISEMMINLIQDETHDYGDLSLRQNKVLNNMLGCEIDFVIKGLDTKSRSIVASRKDAMLKKRQIFYFDRCKKRGRKHQQRKSEKLSGTGKICRNGGRYPQRNSFRPVRTGCQRHCSQLLRQPHRWKER